MKNSLLNWKRFKGSFIYAWWGIWHLLKQEQNLWIVIIIGMVAFFFSWYLGLTSIEKAIIVLVSASVIGAEILNSTVESISDMFHLDQHMDIKMIKDIMAGFVLIWSIAAVIIGVVIFWPYLY